MEKKIQIGVACHKPSVLPKNELYVPIQVGAKKAAKRMPEEYYRYDDDGENISEKNPTYCELTAQYWLWKNVEADYYGLCHYRRFLCFQPNDARRNIRGHIEAYAMDAYNLNRFGLENEAQMREVIESCDIVVGEEQNVARLYTPRGNQATAYNHWAAHDRDLIQVRDLNKMLEIFQEVSPEIGGDAVKYLNGNTFLGFNCFVMRRELFDEMCSIEFEVLRRLEQEVELSDYNQQLSRIYGFMGEIIFSSYVYHAEKSEKYRIKRVPLLYFENTDVLPDYQPAVAPNAIPVLFHIDWNVTHTRFSPAVTWQSFLEHTEDSAYYDVFFCLPNLSAAEKAEYRKMALGRSNMRITFLSYELYYSMMADRVKTRVPLRPFLPWVFKNYDRLMVFGEHVLFADSILPMWEAAQASEKLIAAPCDVLVCAQIADIYVETQEKYLSQELRNPLDAFFAGACVMNLREFRRQFTPEQIYTQRLDQFGELRFYSLYLNAVCEGCVEKLEQRWNTLYVSNDYLKYAIPRTPFNKLKQLQAAQRHPGVVSYMENDAMESEPNELTYLYWDIARRTPFYEQNLSMMMEFKMKCRENPSKDVLNTLFPRGKRMRGILSCLFPKGSRRNRVVKKVLAVFHLR